MANIKKLGNPAIFDKIENFEKISDFFFIFIIDIFVKNFNN